MQWVFRRCLTGIPNDGIPNNGMSSNNIRYNGSRTEYPTSGIPSGGNAHRLECPTLNFLLGIHDNTPRIPNDGIPNIGMSSNYLRYNM